MTSETMLAAVLHAPSDLRVEEVPVPQFASGQVLVRVEAAGVCSSDIARIFETGTYKFPLIPGHELAGEVVACANDVEVRLGARVAVFPLIPCGKCPYCLAGLVNVCREYDYLGSRCDGGFAEYVVAPAANLVAIPEGVSYQEAAMAEPMSVALHAMRRAGVRVGQTVVVIGAGTIGLVAAQWARLSGARRVIIIDLIEEKLNAAAELGFEHVINSGSRDPAESVAKLAGETGPEVVIEAVGKSVTFNLAFDLAARRGVVVLMGNIDGELAVPRKRVSSILRKELDVRGTWNSLPGPAPPAEWRTGLEAVAAGRIELARFVTHRYPLSRINEALEFMANAAEPFFKVMILTQQG